MFPDALEAVIRRYGDRMHPGDVYCLNEALLAGDLPWTRIRQVYALLGLARLCGNARMNAACETALVAEMLTVRRLAPTSGFRQ